MLSELIEKYINKNLINIEYRQNGTVSVWISPNDKEKSEDE